VSAEDLVLRLARRKQELVDNKNGQEVMSTGNGRSRRQTGRREGKGVEDKQREEDEALRRFRDRVVEQYLGRPASGASSSTR